MTYQQHGEKVELTGMLAEFRDALEEEIEKIKKSGQSSTLLYSGRQIESNSPELWYRFNVEYLPTMPADTPCKLTIGKEQFDVTVINCDENSIILSSKNALPATIARARLENGATILMERLIQCIEANAERDNIVGSRMLPIGEGVYSAKRIFDYNDSAVRNKPYTSSQKDAIISALSNDITYIWGPPGTGKTTVIGQIIDELYKNNRTVLVVSHTNTAVDGAIEKADKAYLAAHPNDSGDYPILRIGIPTKPLNDRTLLSSHVENIGKELYKQQRLLEKQQAELHKKNNDITSAINKWTWVNTSRLSEVSKIVAEIEKDRTEIFNTRKKIDDLTSSLAQEKELNPEAAIYGETDYLLKLKRNLHETICGQISKNEAAIVKLESQIDNADEEIRKHDVYANLIAQESKYMPARFLEQEIAKCNEAIALKTNEINTLTAKKHEAQQTINAYERKGSVAKLFSAKAAVNQAQYIAGEADTRLHKANGEREHQRVLVKEYTNQLESLLLIQAQIKAITPSKTREYWFEASHNLKNQLLAIRESAEGFQSKKAHVYEEICSLAQQQLRAKEAYERICGIEKELADKQTSLRNIEESFAQLTNKHKEILAFEREFCISFGYIPTADDLEALYDELSRLIGIIKSEIKDTDVATLKEEKEIIAKQQIELFALLNELKAKMQELEKQAIMNAKIVGATLAKSYLSETLRERMFDTVILDEASMASIPALWCASYLAEKSLIIVGDFLQLPPIVMAETEMAKKWLGKDIFFHSGMQNEAKNKATCPKNFVMLNEQFRMESDIADIANMYYGAYGGLRTNANSEFRAHEREIFYEWYSGKRTKHNIHLVDTESLHAWVTGVPQGKSHSRLNCFSAAVDVDLAFKCIENKLNALDVDEVEPAKEASVLIVAPYKPHITRINQLIELEYKNRGFKENLNFIRAGTIHSFQGSEADVVIFDLVIDEPHWKANLFMTDKEVNEALEKMFNVAVTRAKFKLYIVGNFAYCQKRAKNNALANLLDKLIKKNRLPRIDAKELLPNITFSRQTSFTIDGSISGNHIVCREESFNDYFMADINSFKKRLIVYSPFMTESRLSVLLPAFIDAVNSGKQIIVVTKALSDRGKTELGMYKKCEEELRNLGINIIHKKGMHEKLIFVDSDAVWIGSLNALSFSGQTGEVMQRHADSELTAEYEKLFDIEHLNSAIINPHEQRCPICGAEMLVKESSDGGIYWECIEGDYSRGVAQQYPLDGVLRCKCGAPYIFSMKNEPRWVCSEDSRHYQKMREGDLKLEKMAALIPTKTARREVDRYFANKRKERDASKKQSQKKSTVNSKKSTSKSTELNDGDTQIKLF